MAKAKNFVVGDKVVWFSFRGGGPRRPVVAWVSSDRWYPSSGEDWVRVSRHEKDAEEGRGQRQHSSYVHHYSDELWASCEAWYEREGKLTADLKKLSKGKVI